MITLIVHTACNVLTVYSGEVGESPYGPVSALWCVSHFDQSQDGLETSVVDVPVAVQIPCADRRHHFVNNLLSKLAGMVTNIFF